MKTKTFALAGLLAVALLFSPQSAQAQIVTLTSTTTSAAILATDKVVCLTSATGVVVPGIGTVGSTLYFSSPSDAEAVVVRSVTAASASCFNVVRSTRPVGHASGVTAYIGAPNNFYTHNPTGTCTTATVAVSPWINLQAPIGEQSVWSCYQSAWRGVSGPVLAYLPSGVQQATAHSVFFTCTLGTNCAITLTGAAAFTGATTYFCSATDQTSAAAVKIVNTSGTVVTLTGTGTDVLSGVCLGN